MRESEGEQEPHRGEKEEVSVGEVRSKMTSKKVGVGLKRRES